MVNSLWNVSSLIEEKQWHEHTGLHLFRMFVSPYIGEDGNEFDLSMQWLQKAIMCPVKKHCPAELLLWLSIKIVNWNIISQNWEYWQLKVLSTCNEVGLGELSTWCSTSHFHEGCEAYDVHSSLIKVANRHYKSNSTIRTFEVNQSDLE